MSQAQRDTPAGLDADIAEAIGWVEGEYGFVADTLKRARSEIERLREAVLEESALICERRAARNKAVGRVDAAGSADAR